MWSRPSRAVGATAAHLKLEEWQLPTRRTGDRLALSQGFTGALYVKSARRLKQRRAAAASQFAEVLDRYVGLCRSRGVLDFDLCSRRR